MNEKEIIQEEIRVMKQALKEEQEMQELRLERRKLKYPRLFRAMGKIQKMGDKIKEVVGNGS